MDPDTGELTLHDFVVVQDVGKAINPLGVEGQMQGGAVQSLGIALTEGLLFDENGRLTNPSLLDYRKLTAADLPNIETIIVEVPSPAGPFGARGVGEPPIVPAPAAIANAVRDATGRADHRAAAHAGAHRDGAARAPGGGQGLVPPNPAASRFRESPGPPKPGTLPWPLRRAACRAGSAAGEVWRPRTADAGFPTARRPAGRDAGRGARRSLGGRPPMPIPKPGATRSPGGRR